VAALDERINETVNRLLDSLRDRLESDIGSCRDELLRTAQDATAQVADAVEATAQARKEADEQRSRFTEEIDAVQHQLDDARRETATAREQIDSSRTQIESLNAELDEARKQLDEMRDDVEAALRDIDASRREAEVVRAEVNRLASELRNSDERAAQARRLPGAVRALDEAATFGDVLETLAVRSACEAGRAAVFLVKGNRLRDWRTVGFRFPSDSTRLDIDVSESGPMAEAVRSGEGVCPRAQNSVPEFARTDEPRETAAWPVSVGGSVVAVLYADGPVADKAGEPYWPSFLEVLARHAGRVLEAITVRQAAGLMTGKAIAGSIQ